MVLSGPRDSYNGYMTEVMAPSIGYNLVSLVQQKGGEVEAQNTVTNAIDTQAVKPFSG